MQPCLLLFFRTTFADQFPHFLLVPSLAAMTGLQVCVHQKRDHLNLLGRFHHDTAIRMALSKIKLRPKGPRRLLSISKTKQQRTCRKVPIFCFSFLDLDVPIFCFSFLDLDIPSCPDGSYRAISPSFLQLMKLSSLFAEKTKQEFSW